VRVMEYAYRHQIQELVIHHDYEGVGAWPTRKWKTNLDLTKRYLEFFTKISKKVTVSFEWVKAHNGDEYNEQADRLANLATKTPIERRVSFNERI
jgi:ribonuclease HI